MHEQVYVRWVIQPLLRRVAAPVCVGQSCQLSLHEYFISCMLYFFPQTHIFHALFCFRFNLYCSNSQVLRSTLVQEFHISTLFLWGRAIKLNTIVIHLIFQLVIYLSVCLCQYYTDIFSLSLCTCFRTKHIFGCTFFFSVGKNFCFLRLSPVEVQSIKK